MNMRNQNKIVKSVKKVKMNKVNFKKLYFKNNQIKLKI